MVKKRKVPAPVKKEHTVSEAFAAILLHNFKYLAEWEGAARTWDDIEGVHQTRVAMRKMRSALSAFRQAVPKEASAKWSEELRWMGNELGLARDLDVFIDEGLGPLKGKLPLPGEEEMLRMTELHRAQAYEAVRGLLDSDRYAAFKQEFPVWVKGREWENWELKPKQAERMHMNVVAFARKLLDRLERNVLQAGTHVDQDNAQEMHLLRIECKKLRYAAEFFTPIFDGLDEFIRRMKGLQDFLGVMNDVSVMQHLLAKIFAGDCKREPLQYAGGLVGWRTRQYHELRATFDDRWEEFTQAKHPWWSKKASSN